MDNALKQFDKQSYLNIESFRKNGEGVRTPVWFVEEGEVLYTYTMEQSWKVKRIRNNPRVRIVPCSSGGNPKGEWVDAEAEILLLEEAQKINQLIIKKYGLQKRLIDLLRIFTKGEYVGIAMRIRK